MPPQREGSFEMICKASKEGYCKEPQCHHKEVHPLSPHCLGKCRPIGFNCGITKKPKNKQTLNVLEKAFKLMGE